jgi:hypothetical protein
MEETQLARRAQKQRALAPPLALRDTYSLSVIAESVGGSERPVGGNVLLRGLLLSRLLPRLLDGVYHATVSLAMATRKMTLKAWFKACAASTFEDGFLDLTGPTQAVAAQTLEVSRQRVHQMIEEGALDAVHVTAPNGTISVTYVTQSSLDRYLAARRPFAVDGRYTISA